MVKDLKAIVRDAEGLIEATGEDLSDKASEAKARLGRSLEAARASCERTQKEVGKCMENTNELIHEHPYQAMALGFGLGLLAALMMGRK